MTNQPAPEDNSGVHVESDLNQEFQVASLRLGASQDVLRGILAEFDGPELRGLHEYAATNKAIPGNPPTTMARVLFDMSGPLRVLAELQASSPSFQDLREVVLVWMDVYKSRGADLQFTSPFSMLRSGTSSLELQLARLSYIPRGYGEMNKALLERCVTMADHMRRNWGTKEDSKVRFLLTTAYIAAQALGLDPADRPGYKSKVLKLISSRFSSYEIEFPYKTDERTGFTTFTVNKDW